MIGICAASGAPSGYDDGSAEDALAYRADAAADWAEAERLWALAEIAETDLERSRLADRARRCQQSAESNERAADELEARL